MAFGFAGAGWQLWPDGGYCILSASSYLTWQSKVWAATNLPKQAVLNIAQYILDRASLRWREPNGAKQVGVLPYKLIDGRVVFLLVTSRRTGRWIVPKGSLIKGESRWRSAEIEAIEEAGVEGIIEREPIGTYRTIKKGSVTRQVVEVDLYPLLVTKQHDTWPEQTNRHRHWVLLREGKRLVSDPNLPRLMTEWSRRVLADNQPVTNWIDK